MSVEFMKEFIKLYEQEIEDSGVYRKFDYLDLFELLKKYDIQFNSENMKSICKDIWKHPFEGTIITFVRNLSIVNNREKNEYLIKSFFLENEDLKKNLGEFKFQSRMKKTYEYLTSKGYPSDEYLLLKDAYKRIKNRETNFNPVRKKIKK